MALRGNGKGMLSTMDAMVFLAIMVVVCAGFFAYGSLKRTDGDPLAKTVAEDFLSIELLSSDVYPTEDSQVFPIADLIAVNLATGKGDAIGYAESVIGEMVPNGTAFKAVFAYKTGKTAVGDGAGTPCSEYACEITVAGNGVLLFSLSLY